MMELLLERRLLCYWMTAFVYKIHFFSGEIMNLLFLELKWALVSLNNAPAWQQLCQSTKLTNGEITLFTLYSRSSKVKHSRTKKPDIGEETFKPKNVTEKGEAFGEKMEQGKLNNFSFKRTQDFYENSEVKRSTVILKSFLLHITSHELLRDASVHPQNIATLVHGAVSD